MTALRGPALLGVAAVLVVATLAASLWVMESPATQRSRRLDAASVNDLQAIERAVQRWATTRQRLPDDLASVAAQPGIRLSARDAGGTPYDYARTGGSGYRLCAVFRTSSADEADGEGAPRWADDAWAHPAGRHCFELRATVPPLGPGSD